MLRVTSDHARVFLHIVAAAVWVGGQLTLAGLLPAVRRLGPEATQAIARQFARVAWPAFAVAVATGIWNLLEVQINERRGPYLGTLAAKLSMVVVSGVAAALHGRSRSRPWLALWGALGVVSSLAALLLGVVLRG